MGLEAITMSLSSTDKQWEQWGKKNPYFGVLGVESSSLTEKETFEKFFESGRQHISEVLSHLHASGATFGNEASALDFGCGVGRLLLPLSEKFSHVSGIDISPAMLELARRNLPTQNNVSLFSSLKEAAESRRGGFDLVHSYIVIQHIRPEQGYPVLRELLSLVKPGGCFALHLTLGDLSRMRRFLNTFRYRIPPLHWLYNLSRKRPWNEPITEMNRYDAAVVFDLLAQAGCPSFTVHTYNQARYVGILMIGRKPSTA
jgi:SAM-dependent methyltransferase